MLAYKHIRRAVPQPKVSNCNVCECRTCFRVFRRPIEMPNLAPAAWRYLPSAAYANALTISRPYSRASM